MLNKQLFYLFFFYFLQFYLTSLRGKEYFWPNLTNSQEQEPFFWPLEQQPEVEPLEKKYQEPEPLGKKIRSWSRNRLRKKSGAGAAKKLAGSPAMNYWKDELTILEYFWSFFISTHNTYYFIDFINENSSALNVEARIII